MSKIVRLAGNKDWIAQEGRLRYFAAAKSVVTTITPLAQSQLFQIIFAKSDGSIILVPFFRGDLDGVVSRLRAPAGGGGPVTLSYTDRGKVTQQLVKLSHHTSGRAHFNLSGRTTNEIGKRSAPLTEPNVLLFQFSAYWLSGLELLESPRTDRPYLPFAFSGSGVPTAITVTGRWVEKAWLVERARSARELLGPITNATNERTGKTNSVMFVGQPDGWPLRNHILMLEASIAMPPTGVDIGTILLLAGLDHPGNPDPEAKPGFNDALLLMYPAKTDHDLRQRIGSIDLPPR